jgi:two-component system nitrate/nitrite response regulator NarL
MHGNIEVSNDPRGTRVLLVDDHSLICETLMVALGADPALDLETASSVDGAHECIAKHGRYDVILLDYEVPGMNGLDGLRKLIAANSGSVALFSGVASRTVVERALDVGASGFIPKTLPLKTLKHAIRFISDGETFVPADFTRQAGWNQGETVGLKPREMKVLGYLCEGLQNKEIGREMDLAETIVKLDVKSICRKLGAKNRTQAVIEARKQGLF